MAGIEVLVPLDCLLIKQKVTGVGNSKYAVTSSSGEVVLHAKEDSSLMSKIFNGKSRAFCMDICNGNDDVVIKLRRPFTFGTDKMDVSVGGQLVAVVRQEMTFFTPVMRIYDGQDRALYKVKGPINKVGDCDFKVYTLDKKQTGVISHVWGGAMREMMTTADSYRVQFPAHLPPIHKAAILATCFLIDFLHYDG